MMMQLSKILSAGFALMLLATPAVAEEVDLLSTRKATDPDLQLSAEACRQLVVHQPAQDGDATYRPGVDVHGRPVVEADIGGAALPPPDVVEFRLTVDMAQYLNLNVSPMPEGQIGLGTISVLPDGTVLRDGQPMESGAETALRALCIPKKQK